MSGTSLDGLDLAYLEITGRKEQLGVESIQHAHVGFGSLGSRLRRALGEALSAAEWSSLAHDLGQLHAEAISSAWPDTRFDLVAAHGQTLYHAPPLSLQLLNPWPIAQTLQVAVVCDLRGADLAAGGEGAPITPYADRVLYRDHIGPEGLAIVNLGGFANATLLTEEIAVGFDCCPCNHLLDAVARKSLGQPFDLDGEAAMGGTPDDELAESLCHTISQLNAEGRSGGTGDEGIELVISEQNNGLDQRDHLATIADAIARAIAKSLQETPASIRICLAGGGARNAALRRAIQRHCRGEVVLSDQLGVPIEAREAAAMAVLGAMAADGLPVTNAETTGHSSTPQRAGTWIFPEVVNRS
jgi:1,6-anhydro-N-acetylmuramate kinase